MHLSYRPGGFKKGAKPKTPSGSKGSPMILLKTSGDCVLPFHVLNHGPPPTSTAAMLLVTSKIT